MDFSFPIDLLNIIGQYCDLCTFLNFRKLLLLQSLDISFKSYFTTAGVIPKAAVVTYNDIDLLRFICKAENKSLSPNQGIKELQCFRFQFKSIDIACGYGNIE